MISSCRTHSPRLSAGKKGGVFQPHPSDLLTKVTYPLKRSLTTSIWRLLGRTWLGFKDNPQPVLIQMPLGCSLHSNSPLGCGIRTKTFATRTGRVFPSFSSQTTLVLVAKSLKNLPWNTGKPPRNPKNCNSTAIQRTLIPAVRFKLWETPLVTWPKTFFGNPWPIGIFFQDSKDSFLSHFGV